MEKRNNPSENLDVTVQGPDEETPERWADLVGFVLAALRRARRVGPNEEHTSDAA